MDGYGIIYKATLSNEKVNFGMKKTKKQLEDNLMKVCVKCKILKQLDEFCKNKREKDGYSARCRLCCAEYKKANADKTKEQKKQYRKDNLDKIRKQERQYYKANADKIKEQKKQYRKDNPEKIRQYYKNNIDKIKEQKKQYRKDNPDKIKERGKQYRKDNIEKTKQYKKNNADKIKEYEKQYRKDNIDKAKEYGKQYGKQYRKENQVKIKEQNKQYRKQKRENDPAYRIKENLRNGLNRVIKYGSKTRILKDYLGCTPEELKKYLESLFKPGMSWDNYGYDTWHIDHIIPMATIKSESDIEQIKIVCHYTNLQPLWAEDNLKKGDKIE